MQGAVESQTDLALGEAAGATGAGEMGPLIEALHAWIRSRPEAVTRVTIADADPAILAREVGLSPRRKGRAEVILASNVAVELGHPSTASRTCVLTTHQPGIVRRNRVSVVGPDLDRAEPRARWPLGQVVMVEVRPETSPDPFALESTQTLVNRLPGFMVRTVPGRLWIRVSEAGVMSGSGLRRFGQALIAAYRGDFPEVSAVEVLFVTRDDETVEALAPVVLEASVTAGQHKKLALAPDGDLDCVEMSCERCEEKPVCDDLREILRQRRRRR